MLGFILHFIKIMPINDGIIQAVIDPLTLGLIAGGVQAAVGGIQALTAGKRQQEPKYEIPKEVFDVTKQAQEMAQTGMPEASRMMAQQGAQQAAIFRQRMAAQTRVGQANIASSESLLARDLLSIASEDARKRQENQLRAQQALMYQIGFRDKEFANRWQSWMNREQQRRANVGAGMQNIARGLTMGANLGMMGMQLGNTNDTTTTTVTPPAENRFPTVQLPSYSAPAQSPAINALSGIINAPQLPSNMTNTGGNFLFGSPF